MKLPRRILLLPTWVVGTFLLMYAMCDALLFLAIWRGGMVEVSQAVDLVLQFNFAGAMLTVAAGVKYGVYRVVAFHPLCRGEYRDWLKSTPWKPPCRLPLGPVHLVWQDFVLLLVMWLSMFRYRWIESIESNQQLLLAPLFPILLFLLVYVITLGLTFRPTGVPGPAYLLAAGFGLVVLLKMELLPSLVVTVAMYAVAYFGLRKSLARFHQWDIGDYEKTGLFGAVSVKTQQKTHLKQLGWPFNIMSPRKGEVGISHWDAILCSLLCGWWVFVVTHTADVEIPKLRVFLGLTCVLVALVRTAIYCGNHVPPISFLGRLHTHRLIIPGYDKVFLAPLATVLAWLVTSGILLGLNVPGHAACAIACTAMLLVALCMGPTYEQWRLTGHHRIVVPPMPANSPAAKQA